MSKTLVKNPTGSAKAVRVKGGHVVLKRGKSEQVDLSELSKQEIANLKKAGLLFGEAAKSDPTEEEKAKAAQEVQAKLDADKKAADDKAAADKKAKEDADAKAAATPKKD